jgi:serine protease Do
MKRILSLCLSLLLVVATLDGVHAQQTRSPQMVKLFREVVAKSAQSTVRVVVDDREAALGVIVSADGWILTKHSELKSGKIICRLAGDKEYEAELVNFDVPFDLALLKVDAKDLTPVEWTDSKASKAGHWVASAGLGEDVVAIGVISVPAREVKGSKFTPPSGATAGGYLGLALYLDFAGVKVQEVFKDTPAQKAGLQPEDQIIALNGEAVMNTDDFLGLLAKNKPGDAVKLTINREMNQQDLKVTLGQRPGTKGGKSRGDIQNNMGSKLSDRRAGFPVILQHDSVIKPNDCGGPLVNLEGKVLGINIARAGRTESYSIPCEVVRPLVEKLKLKKSGKEPAK